MHIKRCCTLKFSYWDKEKKITINKILNFDSFTEAYNKMQEVKRKLFYSELRIISIDKVILNRFDLMDFGD